MNTQQTAPRRAAFAVRAPQDLAAGLVILATSGAVLWGLSKISTSRYQSISPTLFPRLCAFLLAAGGVALLVRAFTRSGPGIEPTPLRSVVLVPLAVALFGFLTPIFGYAVAGFITVIVGGLGSTETRIKEILIIAVCLVLFCLALFTWGLGLPIAPFIMPNFLG
jgi:putative tricarboxylic transport membrane protein